MVEKGTITAEYKDTGDINAFKESLQQVTTQLEAVRNSFYQGVEEIRARRAERK